MGFVLFSIGNALAMTGLVLAALGYAQGAAGAWIVALVAMGELTVLGSILMLGDDGYQTLEARGSAILRREAAAKTDSTSARRHGAGMALLLAHLIAYLLVWITGILGYSRASAVDPFPTVFGLSFERQGPTLVWGVIAAELLFVVAIYVLGPAWWGRFEQLFHYAPAAMPLKSEAPKPPPTLRYRIGLGVFIFGNLLAVTGMVFPAFGLASGRMVGVIAVILAAGEITSASSIFLLGKEGFIELKTKLFALLKRTPSGQPVSLRRHHVGVVHFSSCTSWLSSRRWSFPIASHYGVAANATFPTVLGLGPSQNS